jgi:uncharacterized protein (TIGR02118 family)
MVKLTITLSRKDDMGFEAFREYYEEEHAPLAAQLPGLQEYTVTFPFEPEEAPYDAVAELYFEDGEALGKAFGSELGEEVQADAANFADVESMRQFAGEEVDCLE